MDESDSVIEQVRAALRSEARVDLAHHPLVLTYENGDLTIEGEVADIAAKKLALERAAALPLVAGIVDRLRVAPAQPMADDEIRDHVRDALIEEPALAECAIEIQDKGETVSVRSPEPCHGTITVSVADGVVTLDGDVPGLAEKRLAGVLAWWVPGARDVVNGIGVTPPEADDDGQITDAVRLALEKDPFVNADQIRVFTRNAVVTLRGVVPTPSEREMAEFDAWYVFGVDKVSNRIVLQPSSAHPSEV
jgi:osmotically-inducible protein OsmY